MQIKMQNILGFVPFFEAVKDQKLPIKTAYKLAQLTKAAENELAFYREKIQNIINDYAELDEDNRPILVGNEGIKLRPGTENECYNLMQDLQNIEVTMPDVVFDIEEFEKVTLTLADMEALIPFLKE